MDRNFLLYADAGAGDFSLMATERYFGQFGVIRRIYAADIIQGDCLKGAAALIMPGGADLPYCDKLDGAGNNAIRAFAEAGGLYIGICAGAYYACRTVEYHKGRTDEICGKRQLEFYQATAMGSLPEIAPYYDDTLATAAVITLIDEEDISYSAYYFGGCAFHPDKGEDAQILARYETLAGQLPAIILKNIGKGHALLSGVHFEVTPSLLKNYYANQNRNDKKRASELAAQLEKQQTINALLESIWA